MQKDEALTLTAHEELAALKTKLALKNVKFDLMLQVTQAINFNFSEKAILTIFRQLLIGELKINDFALFIAEDGEWKLTLYANEQTASAVKMQVNELLVHTKTGSLNGYVGKYFGWIIPVMHKQQALAYLLIGDLPWASQEVRREMTDYLQTVLNVILVAFENKRLFKRQLEQEVVKKELSLAANIQGLLIPDVLPNNDKLGVDAVYLPHNNIGGDYYDCVKVSKGSYIFCVADVSGKGIPASLLMANFQANFHAHLQPPLRLDWLVATLNRKVLNITKGEKFITLFIGIIDLNTQTLTYVNAGHVPPILMRKQTSQSLTGGSTILGMFDQLPDIKLQSIQLQAGDCILAYTDGVSDVRNEAGKGIEQTDLEQMLYQLSKEQHTLAARNIARRLIDFKGKAAFIDDLTLLSIQIK